MRRVNPDIRHVLIGKAYAAELLRVPTEAESLGGAARLLRDSGATLLPGGRVQVETEDRTFTMAVPETET